MKKYLYLLTIVTLLSSCSENGATESLENDEYTRLNVSFGTPNTYGQAASEDEKMLQSVAFFLETASGEFQSWFTHSDDFEHVKTDDSGNITAVGVQINYPNPDGTARLAIIGNYAENGLTDVLAAIGSLQELAEARTCDIVSQPIASPFLVYLEPTVLKILGGTTRQEHFILKRVAARIDLTLTFWKIISETEREKVAPENLIGYAPAIKIFSPKTQSYLLPGSDADVAALPQAGYEAPTLTHNEKDITLTYYTYENSTQEIAPLIIKVFYSGSGYRDMTLVLKDENDTPVIRRNHYYNPEINIVQVD